MWYNLGKMKDRKMNQKQEDREMKVTVYAIRKIGTKNLLGRKNCVDAFKNPSKKEFNYYNTERTAANAIVRLAESYNGEKAFTHKFNKKEMEVITIDLTVNF